MIRRRFFPHTLQYPEATRSDIPLCAKAQGGKPRARVGHNTDGEKPFCDQTIIVNSSRIFFPEKKGWKFHGFRRTSRKSCVLAGIGCRTTLGVFRVGAGIGCRATLGVFRVGAGIGCRQTVGVFRVGAGIDRFLFLTTKASVTRRHTTTSVEMTMIGTMLVDVDGGGDVEGEGASVG